MYQNWREEDLEAAMTSSSGYPRDSFGTDALWDTESFGMTPTSSFGAPNVSIPVQSPDKKNGLLYQRQHGPWSAQTNDGVMDKETYFNENLENTVEKERCNEMERARPVVYADDENTKILGEKSSVPATNLFQSTSGPDNFWNSNPYKAWNDSPITLKPTEPMVNSMHQLDAPIPGNIDTEELCEKLTQEIHKYYICRQYFAKKVLNKGPKVLRKMLKDPKPWNKLQSARVNYIRIYNWLNLPLEKRLGILDMELPEKKCETTETVKADLLNAPLPGKPDLDTEQLTEQLVQEIKTHEIPQAKFAKNDVRIYDRFNLPAEERMEYFKEDNINCSKKRKSFEYNAIDHHDNHRPIQNNLDVDDSNNQYNQQALQTSTDMGSNDALCIPESQIQAYLHRDDINDQYNHELLQNSNVRMHNHDPMLSNSDTDDSNNQYSHQPNNPYKRQPFPADINCAREVFKKEPFHSVDSILNKMARRTQTPSGVRSPSLNDVARLDDSYRGGSNNNSTKPTSSSSSDSAFEYYEGLLAAPLADGAVLDTKILCDSILQELAIKKIPQAIFAKRVANRCQGTLSELLRKPKPWDCVKTGRGIYVRLYNWYQLPEDQRMEIVDKKINIAVPEKKPVDGKGIRTTEAPAQKKPRTVFLPVQKSALQTIFEENPKPSADVMAHIAQTLELDNDSVANFFQNTRKRTNDQMKRNRHPQNDFQDYQENQKTDYY
ncbi:hypothetical protein L5515_015336 [Caenorhabditis briggsae]|uniref:DNA-binding protein SATB n=2 Tax=Caenorhabditis briggsae TaxID=6238 RepID=A0AAE9EII5_CAEBR|nr:hypothetical protein L5515_015336 [Caenorhabditis briggsae]